MRAFVFPVPLGVTYEGLVAQSVEQRIENPCVGGSIPPRATRIRKSPPETVGFFHVFHHTKPLLINA